MGDSKRPPLHKSDSDPCLSTNSKISDREVSLATSRTISNTATAGFAQLGHVPAALELQNAASSAMAASAATTRSTVFSNTNMTINTKVPESRYFVARVQNAGPLSKRRRTPQNLSQPPAVSQQPAGRVPLPDLPPSMQIPNPGAPAAPISAPMQSTGNTMIRPPTSSSQVAFTGLSTSAISPSKAQRSTPRTPKRKANDAMGPSVGTHQMSMPLPGGGVGTLGMGMTSVGLQMANRLPGTSMIGNTPMGALSGAALRGSALGGLGGVAMLSPGVNIPMPIPHVGGPGPLSGATHMGNRAIGGAAHRGGRAMNNHPTMGGGIGMGLGTVNRVPLTNNAIGLGNANLGVGPGSGVPVTSSLGKSVIKAPPILNTTNADLQPIKNKPKATRRYRHNATERTRTRVISRKISELGVQMTNAGIKVKKEKLLILNSAVEYVSQLQASCVQHDASNKQLEEQIAVMTQELAALKAAAKKKDADELQTTDALSEPQESAAGTEDKTSKIDYEKAFMSQPLPSLLMDHNFGILSCNWLFLLFVNKTKEMVMGKTLLEILYPNPATKLKNWNTIKESFSKSHSVKLEDSAAVDGVTMRFQMIMSQSTCPGGKGQRIEAVFLPFLPARNPAHDNTLRPIRSWNELHFALV